MHGETMLQIAPDHPAFAGHFPGAPIVPGVVLLDATVHAVLHARKSSPPQGRENDLCQISSTKFLSPVGPGETLNISWTTTATGSTRFDISSGNRKVATGLLVFQAVS